MARKSKQKRLANANTTPHSTSSASSVATSSVATPGPAINNNGATGFHVDSAERARRTAFAASLADETLDAAEPETLAEYIAWTDAIDARDARDTRVGKQKPPPVAEAEPEMFHFEGAPGELSVDLPVIIANKSDVASGLAKSGFSKLPLEIVTQIIQCNLAPPSSHKFDDGWFERGCMVLERYILVSSTWKALAQRELYRRPVLRGLAGVRAFWEDLQREPWLGALVEHLRVDGAERDSITWPKSIPWYDRPSRGGPPIEFPGEGTIERETAGYIVAILAACSQVKQIWFRRVRGFQFGWLQHSKELEHLALHRVWCDPEDSALAYNNQLNPSLPLSQLRSLSLNTVAEPSWLPDATTTMSLPRLSSFSFHNTSLKWLELRSPRVLAFVGRLDVLGLTLNDFPSYPMDMPAELTVLWTSVGIPSWPLLPPTSHTSPPTSHTSPRPTAIRHLRLFAQCHLSTTSSLHQIDSVTQLTRGLMTGHPALEFLEVLYLPPYMKGILRKDEQVFLAECRRRGIVIVLEEFNESGSEFTMSDDCWRRAGNAKRAAVAKDDERVEMERKGEQ